MAALPAAVPAGAATPAWTPRATAAVAAGAEYQLLAVSCTAANACTAVGDSGTSSSFLGPLAERWDGTTWKVQSTPNPPGEPQGRLTGVSCSSATSCVAIGTNQSAPEVPAPFSASWDGSTWTVQLLPVPERAQNVEFSAISCVTATWCKAAGEYSTGNFGTIPLLASWDGTSWTYDAVPTPPNTRSAVFNDVDCFAQNACAAVGAWVNVTAGKKAPALAETWNGSTWHVDSASDPGAVSVMYALDCPSATLCIGAGDYSSIAGGLNAQVQRRSGSIWTNSAAPNPNAKYRFLFDISCPTKSNCTALGEKYNSTSAITGYAGSYGGLGWSVQAEPAGYVLSALSCPTTSFCMAVGTALNSSEPAFTGISATRG